jgi:steroid delta-isomerase-like uncharacterized protein
MNAFPALDVVSEYSAALAHQDTGRMNALRSLDFVLDFVHGDAFEDNPLSGRQTEEFWPSWFAAFPEMDIEVTRTIAAEEVVVMQWVFTGTNTGPLQPPILDELVEPTGRTIRLRGVSIYDVADGLLRRETMYIDLATVMVELGVEL